MSWNKFKKATTSMKSAVTGSYNDFPIKYDKVIEGPINCEYIFEN